MTTFTRRRVLRGILQGGAVTVGLPLLNCFLNGNGNAYADGTPLPVRYGTWLWGLGMSKSVFVPKKVGQGYDLPEELVALKNVRDQINLYTNLTAFRDGGRKNSLQMTQIAAKLNDREIKAVADYIAGLR